MTTEQINSIIASHELGNEYFVWQMQCAEDMDSDERLEAFFKEQNFNEEDEKVFALMEYTGDNWEEAETDYDSDNYKVLTDDEADDLLDKRLDEYIDDNILCTIDSAYHMYFDRDAWKTDNEDDRGAWLNYRNGSEEEETINETTYYIYQQ